MELQNIELEVKDRIIRGLQYDKDASKGVIILYHGLMDSYAFPLIKEQAMAYADKGYVVLTFDFIGHGTSDGKLLDMTLSKEFEDGQAILDYALDHFQTNNIILIGHSQGGVVASVIASNNTRKVKKLVLEVPAGHIADTFRFAYKDTEIPEKTAVFDDFISKDYVEDAMKLNLYEMASGFKGRSVLLVSAGMDPIVGKDKIQRYKEVYKYNEVKWSSINRAPHDFEGYVDVLIQQVLLFIEKD